MTIFGNEKFFDKEIAKIYKAQNNYIYDSLHNALQSLGGIYCQVDKGKLKKWIDLCLQLDNIEKTDLIDIATKKRFNEMQQEINKQRMALDLMLSELKHYAKYVLEDYIVDSWKVEDFIEQERENMKNESNN